MSSPWSRSVARSNEAWAPASEVLRTFLRLGLTSFGGPIAHLACFRDELVARRRWMDEEGFADLVALCQFLPGPASSQVAFAMGVGRAGFRGGLAAWTGFTLPSAALLLAFALGAHSLQGATGAGALHGLKLVAVAIVAQAVFSMARALCPDRTRAGIALASALVVLAGFSSLNQVCAILLGGIAGVLFCRDGTRKESGALPTSLSRRASVACLAAFFGLLLALPLLRASHSAPAELFGSFYRSGALVFGGGHVVLPLLREAVVGQGLVSDDAFLAGYGAAQAVPGPLFSFAAYLGAAALPARPLFGGLVALVAIFLPGMLILCGALPFWDAFRRVAWAQSAMQGINAAVVGLLGVALFDPVWSSAVHGHADFAIALAGFVLLTAWKAPPIVVVALGAGLGALTTLLG